MVNLSKFTPTCCVTCYVAWLHCIRWIGGDRVISVLIVKNLFSIIARDSDVTKKSLNCECIWKKYFFTRIIIVHATSHVGYLFVRSFDTLAKHNRQCTVTQKKILCTLNVLRPLCLIFFMQTTIVSEQSIK